MGLFIFHGYLSWKIFKETFNNRDEECFPKNQRYQVFLKSNILTSHCYICDICNTVINLYFWGNTSGAKENIINFLANLQAAELQAYFKICARLIHGTSSKEPSSHSALPGCGVLPRCLLLPDAWRRDFSPLLFFFLSHSNKAIGTNHLQSDPHADLLMLVPYSSLHLDLVS